MSINQFEMFQPHGSPLTSRKSHTTEKYEYIWTDFHGGMYIGQLQFALVG